MEAAESGSNRDVRWKTAAFQLETVSTRPSPKQTTQADEVLKSLSPLINSMRPFGLYFTRRPRVSCQTTSKQRVGKCHEWNFARIYATIILIVTWLVAFRYAAIFDGTETLGAALFMKLAFIPDASPSSSSSSSPPPPPSPFLFLFLLFLFLLPLLPDALMNALLQTAYYVACHTGSLDQVLRQASLSMVELSPKYGRRTKVVVVVVWILFAWGMVHYVYQLFSDGRNNDVTLITHIQSLPESSVYIVKAVFIGMQLYSLGTWLFPQAMKIVDVSDVCQVFLDISSFECFSPNFPQAMNYRVMAPQVMNYMIIVPQAMN